MRNATVLVVDDEPLIRWSLVNRLKEEGYRAVEAGTASDAVALQREGVDLILLDYALPDANGLEVLKQVKQNDPDILVIMLTANTEVGTAVSAMKQGAFHYANKPFDLDEIMMLVEKALETTQLRREVRTLRARQAQPFGLASIVGESEPIKTVREMLHKIGVSPASTVLLTGESGTGKDLAAKVIHYSSSRAARPFMNITCSALPETLLESELFGHERGAFTGADRQKRGLLESADGGTVFLDEIGEMVPLLQAKLLRFLEEKTFKRVGGSTDIRVDVRVVAATNRSLEEEVKKGHFREDLYYRLNVIPIRMPALRDRLEDLPELARFFLRRYDIKFRKNVQGIAESTLDILSSYWWPGNIRELENLIERLVAVSDKDWITDEDLPYELHVAKLDTQDQAATENLLERALSTFERNFIVRALEKSSWNVTATSRALGIPLSTLKFKMDKLEIRQLARRIRGT